MNSPKVKMKSNRNGIQSFDEILVEHVGGFGSWQLLIFVLLSIPATFKSSESMIQTLTGFSPPHRQVSLLVTWGSIHEWRHTKRVWGNFSFDTMFEDLSYSSILLLERGMVIKAPISVTSFTNDPVKPTQPFCYRPENDPIILNYFCNVVSIEFFHCWYLM